MRRRRAGSSSAGDKTSLSILVDFVKGLRNVVHLWPACIVTSIAGLTSMNAHCRITIVGMWAVQLPGPVQLFG